MQAFNANFISTFHGRFHSDSDKKVAGISRSGQRDQPHLVQATTGKIQVADA